MSGPKIVLGVCTLQYEKQCVDALLGLASSNIFAGYCIPDTCLLPQARNEVIKAAYDNNPDFTHLMFIDDDMCAFGPQHIQRLWSSMDNIPDCSVISALVTTRRSPYKIVAHFSEADIDDEQYVVNLIRKKIVKETRLVGMAFTLIKRELLDVIVEQTPDGPAWFTTDRSPRATFNEETLNFINMLDKKRTNIRKKLQEAIAFGQMSHIGSQLVGEDIAFSRRAKAAGFKLFVDCGCSVGHIGKVGFDFRHTFVKQEPEPKLEIVV